MSKLERSRAVKNEQPENILPIDVTPEVPKLERSRAVKDEQPENISSISVTSEVSKVVRSREVKDEQALNIPLISVTCEVLRCSKPSMCFSDLREYNHRAVLLGRKSRNEASKTAMRTVVLGDNLAPAQAGVRTVVLGESQPVQMGRNCFDSFFFSSIPHVVPSRSARKAS